MNHIDFDVEQLESRRLLAGIVKINVNLRGDLVVTGDAADNEVVITIDETGRPIVSDYHSYDPEQATQIQGNLWDPAKRVSRKVFIDLGDGDDSVRLWLFDHVPSGPIGDIIWNAGAGDDSIRLVMNESQAVRGSVTVIGGPGDDELDLFDTHIQNDLIIGAGSGDDIAKTGRIHGIGGNVWVDMGTGNDSGSVGDYESQRIEGNVMMRSLSGDNALGIREVTVGGDVRQLTGDGNDQVIHQPIGVDGRVVIRTAAGDDLVRASSTHDDKITIDTAAGNDEVFVSGNTKFNIHTGVGDDLIDVNFLGTDADGAILNVDMSAGMDRLQVNRFRGRMYAIGGSGADELDLRNTLAVIDHFEFEDVFTASVIFQ